MGKRTRILVINIFDKDTLDSGVKFVWFYLILCLLCVVWSKLVMNGCVYLCNEVCMYMNWRGIWGGWGVEWEVGRGSEGWGWRLQGLWCWERSAFYFGWTDKPVSQLLSKGLGNCYPLFVCMFVVLSWK